jgi:hypothetical protein
MLIHWWLSFATGGFVGVAIVRAETADLAIKRATELGINPGGEVLVVALPDDAMADAEISQWGVDRLISKAELDAGGYVQFETQVAAGICEQYVDTKIIPGFMNPKSGYG